MAGGPFSRNIFRNLYTCTSTSTAVRCCPHLRQLTQRKRGSPCQPSFEPDAAVSCSCTSQSDRLSRCQPPGVTTEGVTAFNRLWARRHSPYPLAVYSSRVSSRCYDRCKAVASTVEAHSAVDGTDDTPTDSPLSRRWPLDDVIDIRGVRFERWKKSVEIGKKRDVADGGNKKLLLLYLPGIDGLGSSIEPQLHSLAQRFDVFRLLIDAEDRSTFASLTSAATDFVDKVEEGTRLVVVGESFGGMLALRLAQLRAHRIQGLFPINPATSFFRTSWRALGPLLSLAPRNQYNAAAIAVFAATIPDQSQMRSVLDVMFDPNSGIGVAERPRALIDRLAELWGIVSDVSDNLPPETLRWRIQNWLSVGQARVERGLRDMKVNVTVIAGSDDRLLPSVQEARRLEALIPNCRTVVLKGRGHAPFYGNRDANLSEIIAADPALEGITFPPTEIPDMTDLRREAEDRKKREMGSLLSGVYSRDWVEDFEEPDEQTIEEGRKTIEFLIKSVSPVVFSTVADGTSVEGLSGIPDPDRKKPLLFVGNHQLMGLDLGVIIDSLYSEKGILARGLTHPFVFTGNTTPRVLDRAVDGVVEQDNERGRRTKPDETGLSEEDRGMSEGQSRGLNSMQQFFSKFGAVPVSPRNMYRLLSRGDNVLLFPGGVNEAYHTKGEAYNVIWPEKGEFVRLAAECGATIVPFSAIGIADSLEMVLDGNELLRVPFVGDSIKRRSEGLPTARGGAAKEQFVSPVVLPKLPSRVYVRFGEAMNTDGLDRRDRVACQETYERVKNEVELGIDALLRARERDPFLNPPSRLLYERVRGQKAPTLQPAELDAAVARARLVRGARLRHRRRGTKAHESGGVSRRL